MTNDSDPWADLDRRPEPLSRLTTDAGPPGALEERVVRTLRKRGILARPVAGRARRWILSAAAVLAAVSSGFLLGRRAGVVSKPEGLRYALLLYEDRSFQAPPPGEAARYVAEYGRWASEVNAAGTGLTGEELSPIGRTLDSAGRAVDRERSADGESILAGFFIVTAADLDRATAIARTCPHLKHGGTVVIRPIEPT